MMRAPLLGLVVLSFAPLASAAEFEDFVRPFLERHCIKCHGREKTKGKIDFAAIHSAADADKHFELWDTVAEVLELGEMPPEDEGQPPGEEVERLLSWQSHQASKSVEAKPGEFAPRRLSGPEYENTLQSLFGFELRLGIAAAEQTVTEHSLVATLLPTDPPGASGFVNDTHTAPLTSTLWDAYSQLSEAAIDELFSPVRREQLSGMLGEALPEGFEAEQLSQRQAQTLIENFAPRAFRRPLAEEQLAAFTKNLIDKEGAELVTATKAELKVILMSPPFLYRGLLHEGKPGARQAVDPFELAERLSYFLWEDMPDAELSRTAADGTLSRPGVLAVQVDRMLASPKARRLASSFGVQWLKLDAILETVGRDPMRRYAFSSQPVDFLDYLFTENRPLMELIDSDITFANNMTSGFYPKDRGKMKRFEKAKGIERQTFPNQRLALENTEERGGILTMPGVLMMNPGPILRGTWMLRYILGEHLGEPPADVPPIKPSPPGKNLSFRERFEIHRSNASCARCHEKIDPLGFALERYANDGKYRAPGKGKKPGTEIDTSGQLPGGEKFSDFAELKQLLLTTQRERVIRNIVERTLSYALCRKLERHDQPTVDAIAKKMHETGGSWRDLFVEVALSLPFRETSLPPEDPS